MEHIKAFKKIINSEMHILIKEKRTIKNDIKVNYNQSNVQQKSTFNWNKFCIKRKLRIINIAKDIFFNQEKSVYKELLKKTNYSNDSSKSHWISNDKSLINDKINEYKRKYNAYLKLIQKEQDNK